jgi:hypothetical protein
MWKTIVVDFSIPQTHGLKLAVKECFGNKGLDHLNEILRGCLVHFIRSGKRCTEATCSNEDDKKDFLKLLFRIPKHTNDEANEIFSQIQTLWPGSEKWCKWWMNDEVLTLLTAENLPEELLHLPSNTNG